MTQPTTHQTNNANAPYTSPYWAPTIVAAHVHYQVTGTKITNNAAPVQSAYITTQQLINVINAQVDTNLISILIAVMFRLILVIMGKSSILLLSSANVLLLSLILPTMGVLLVLLRKFGIRCLRSV